MSANLNPLCSLNSQAAEQYLLPRPAAGRALTLRPYQAEALAAAEAYLAAGGRAGLLALPMGAGKSVLLASLAQRIAARGGRALVLAHVAELIGQNAAACGRVAGEASVGVYAANAGRREADRPITVASIQTVWRMAEQLGPQDLVLVDEAHLINPEAGSRMYRRLLRDVEALAQRAELRVPARILVTHSASDARYLEVVGLEFNRPTATGKAAA